MARTPFRKVLLAPGLGGGTYTVPAGKIAICNTFDPIGFPQSNIPSAGGTGIFAPRILKINGVDSAAVLAYAFHRYGPLVFNQGDTVSCSGYWNAGQIFPTDTGIALVGFEYPISTRKDPLGQVMIINSSSYTVPAGKHCVVNFFPVGGNALVKIDSDPVATVVSPGPLTGGVLGHGPITANAGQVITLTGSAGAGLAGVVYMNGFTYQNIA